MSKLIYSMMVSLDGYIEGPKGALDWAIPDKTLHRHFNKNEATIDTHLFGRRTYEGVLGYWGPPFLEKHPKAPAHEREYAAMWETKPKVVFSKTFKSTEPHTRVARHPVAEVKKLKARTKGKLWLDGGPQLAATLFAAGLIDECWVFVCPVTVGGGKPFFPRNQRLALALASSERIGGVQLLKYRCL